MPADIREFPDAVTLARALATHVAQMLAAALVGRGQASLAVSGGRTPVRFFEALSERPIDWTRVTITLVDERWVPPVSDRSNAGLVARHLIRGPASEARFVPLTDGLSTPEDRRDAVERTLATVPWPLDVVVLGMGDDGHTASFFPGGDTLARCLDPANPHRVEAMRAPGAGEPRITLTLSALLAGATPIVHFEGGAKRAVLDRALQPGPAEELPIRAVLEHAREPVPVFTCP